MTRQRWPRFRPLVAAVAVTWLASVVGVVGGVVTHNWPVAIYATASAVNAAGWLIAAIEWTQWQYVARTLAAELEARRWTRD